MKKYLMILSVVIVGIGIYFLPESNDAKASAMMTQTVDTFICADCGCGWSDIATQPGTCPTPPNCGCCNVAFVNSELLNVETSPVNGWTYYTWRLLSAQSTPGGGGSGTVTDDRDETEGGN